MQGLNNDGLFCRISMKKNEKKGEVEEGKREEEEEQEGKRERKGREGGVKEEKREEEKGEGEE